MKRKPVHEGRPPAFSYKRSIKNGELFADETALRKIADKYGTPLYVYSGSTIRNRFKTFDTAFGKSPHTVCYSVKANSNLSILRMLAALGSGFDVVSGGELERVRRADAKAVRRVVFSGVGKTGDEMDLALRSDILMYNVESPGEIALLAARAAKLKKKARVALRVNPDVFAETHPYISTGLHKHKFGIPIDQARKLYKEVAKSKFLEVAGVTVHIGSQITSTDPFNAAMQRVADFVCVLKKDGHNIRYVDAGGGLGISYHEGKLSEFQSRAEAYAKAVLQPLQELNVHLLLEPGRSIVAPSGILLTRALYLKKNESKQFVIVDAAMNDLIRPSLYGAHHDIVPVERSSARTAMFDVVGPICETGDFFARDRELPQMKEGDLLAILDAGAYGMSISSNYNTRSRPAELMVDGKKVKVIRKRETVEDQIKLELL